LSRVKSLGGPRVRVIGPVVSIIDEFRCQSSSLINIHKMQYGLVPGLHRLVITKVCESTIHENTN